jgi:hypothetical protein
MSIPVLPWSPTQLDLPNQFNYSQESRNNILTECVGHYIKQDLNPIAVLIDSSCSFEISARKFREKLDTTYFEDRKKQLTTGWTNMPNGKMHWACCRAYFDAREGIRWYHFSVTLLDRLGSNSQITMPGRSWGRLGRRQRPDIAPERTRRLLTVQNHPELPRYRVWTP